MKSKPSSERRARTQKASPEWVGGLFALRATVKDAGGAFQPEVLIWMNPDGLIAGSRVGAPGQLVEAAVDSLREAMTRPLSGPPQTPARLRVANEVLAASLRVAFPTMEIRCAPTPELDPVVDALSAHMGAAVTPTYLGDGVEPAAMGALFEALAGLYAARPWGIVPGDETVFGVTIEKLGLRDVVLLVMGQLGQQYGIVQYASVDTFRAYLAATEALERGHEPRVPAHAFATFEKRAALPPELRTEIKTHGWKVAGPSGYPLVLVVDEHMEAGPLSPDGVTGMEAVARAVTVVLEDKMELLGAWLARQPYERTVTVATHRGEVDVLLRPIVVPRPPRRRRHRKDT